MRPLFFGILLLSSALAASGQNPGRAVIAERHRALLGNHCQKCHDAEKQKGKFRVDDLPLAVATLEDAERWQKVLNQLNSGEMPPEEEKQPPKAQKADFLEELANVMVTARRNLADQKGAITMRRLNRREYKNTLRELLGVEVNVSELPSDTGTGAFDTVGSNLFMSGNQFEQYQSLSREALSEAFDRIALYVSLREATERIKRLGCHQSKRPSGNRRRTSSPHQIDRAENPFESSCGV